jgi:hypothetical protein
MVTAWAQNAAEDLVAAAARAEAGWVVAAVVLHVSGQVCRGVAWRGVLAASFPQVTRRRACVWHVCGSGLSGVLSPRGGDAVRMALAKRELRPRPGPPSRARSSPRRRSRASAGSLVAVAAVSIGVGMLAAPSAGFVGLVAGVLGLMAVLAARCAVVRRLVSELGRGLAVLRDPRRFATCVAPWQVAGRALRMAAVWCFLHAAGLPTGVAMVLAACAVQGSGSAIPIPGAGLATAAAGLLVALPVAAGRPLDPAAVTTLAVLMPAALTAVGVTLSLALLSSIVGLRTPRSLFATARALSPRAADATP